MSRSFAARSPRSIRLRQLDLLVGLEQAEATGFAQELLKGLQKDLVGLKQRGRGGDAVQYSPFLLMGNSRSGQIRLRT